MAERRLKHWGWGYEDQQPSHDEVVAAAQGIRAHLGFGEGEVERPVALEDVELRAPRIEPPAGLRLRGDPHARASHALGKAYRDVVRGFRGEFADPPDVVAHPRDEADVERWLSWCADADAVAIPFGGGTSVVGGVEARESTGRSCRSTCARSTGCSRWTRRRAPRASRAAPPARCWRNSSRSTASRCATTPSRSSTPRSAAGSPPGRAGTSPRCGPTSTTSWSRCARSPRRARGRAAACPARARARAPTGC